MSETVTWHFAARTDDLSDDFATGIVLGDHEIAFCKFQGHVYAVDNICTHEEACLSDGVLDGDEIECPLHMARFKITTGEALSPMAPKGLRCYKIRQDGGSIFIALDA